MLFAIIQLERGYSMKKSSFIDKLITAGIVAAGVGGALYLLKDKLEEDPRYQESLDKAKSTIKKYTATVKNAVHPDDVDAFEDFEDLGEILQSGSRSDRGYVTIKLHDEDTEE
jgi:hypothetical protein